jgi:hypothetical protein
MYEQTAFARELRELIEKHAPPGGSLNDYQGMIQTMLNAVHRLDDQAETRFTTEPFKEPPL